MDLKSQISSFVPGNEQERADRELLLRLLKEPQVFTRENSTGHFTASGWVVSPDRKRC